MSRENSDRSRHPTQRLRSVLLALSLASIKVPRSHNPALPRHGAIHAVTALALHLESLGQSMRHQLLDIVFKSLRGSLLRPMTDGKLRTM